MGLKVTKSIDLAMLIVRMFWAPFLESLLIITKLNIMKKIDSIKKINLKKTILSIVIGAAFVEKIGPSFLTISIR